MVEGLLLACLIAAPNGGGDPILLEFTSATCGPCRSMQPVLDRLQAGGYPVRQIDVAQYPDIARRYRVSNVPCFVMLVADQEVDRVVGVTSQARLLRMFEAADEHRAADRMRGQSPDSEVAATASEYGNRLSGELPSGRSPSPGSDTEKRLAQPRTDAQQRALAATVRITVEDSKGNSIATGTIVDAHGDEALVVTCGHVFRESKGQGVIRVELQGPAGFHTVSGHYLIHDCDAADIALIAIRPGVPVSPARVAPAGFRPARGDRAFSIGCDHGAPPSIRETSISAINKYLGAPNIEAVGQPVEGRSGGGLFASNGALIGICYAADAEDNEGLYTALPTIHQQLAALGLEHLYQNQTDPGQLAIDRPVDRAIDRAPRPGALPPSPRPYGDSSFDPDEPTIGLPAREPLPLVNSDGSSPEAGPIDDPMADDGAEVICIVRRRGDVRSSKVLVLDRASATLLDQLERESQQSQQSPRDDADAARVTSRPAPRTPQTPPVTRRNDGPVIRAQSKR